jgi:helix-turn-helix protein
VFEIGNSLREARMRRGVDFAQAELATKIRGKYLRALEDEQFSLLPAQTYVKGFLRTYAEYLGLDGQLYVDEFNSRFVAGDEHEPRTRRSTGARPQHRHRRLETNVVLLALGAIAILTVVVISAWKASGGGGGETPTSSLAAPTTTAARRPHVPAPLLEVTALRGQAHLIVHKGSATGDVVFDGTISKGDPPRAIRGTRLWVSVDTPENLRIRVSGRLARVPGAQPRIGIVTKTGWHAAGP